MEKKGIKNFWIGVLFAILLVAAVVGGVFTYKYFTEKDNDANIMTMAEAKTVVNKIYSDVGFSEPSTSSNLALAPNLLSASLDSYTFEGFNPVVLPEDSIPLENNVYWIHFFIARYFLNNYNIETNKLYTIEGPVCDIGVYFMGEENSFSYWFFPIMENHDEYYRIEIATISGDDWVMSIIYKPNSKEVANDVFKGQTGGVMIAHKDGKISQAISYGVTFKNIDDIFNAKGNIDSKDKLTGFSFENEDRKNNKKTTVIVSKTEGISDEMYNCAKEVHSGWFSLVEEGIDLSEVLKQVPAKVDVKYNYFLELYNELIGG